MEFWTERTEQAVSELKSLDDEELHIELSVRIAAAVQSKEIHHQSMESVAAAAYAVVDRREELADKIREGLVRAELESLDDPECRTPLFEVGHYDEIIDWESVFSGWRDPRVPEDLRWQYRAYEQLGFVLDLAERVEQTYLIQASIEVRFGGPKDVADLLHAMRGERTQAEMAEALGYAQPKIGYLEWTSSRKQEATFAIADAWAKASGRQLRFRFASAGESLTWEDELLLADLRKALATSKRGRAILRAVISELRDDT